MSRLLPVLAALAVLLVACGDDEESGRTATVPADRPIRVAAEEYSFDPGSLVVQGSGRLRIVLRNDGSLAHNLVVFQGDRQLGGTTAFAGGQTRSATVALKPGEYRYVCTVGDHEQLGMRGTLEVR